MMYSIKTKATQILCPSGFRIFARFLNFQSRNPRDPHFEKKKLLEVCKPIYVEPQLPAWETCPHSFAETKADAHPYEKILSEELKKNWKASKMVLFYHMNPLTVAEEKEIRKLFFKKDLFFHVYSSTVVKLALDGTEFYRSISHLFESSSAFLFSGENLISEALMLNRKTSQIVLLAGIIDNMFYSRNQLTEISNLSKKPVREELVGLLDCLTSKISQNVCYHSQILCHYLNDVSKEK
ncbi:39S ribosomal protein L10, mitochondrial, partial [Stegodyphus mimosarum]